MNREQAHTRIVVIGAGGLGGPLAFAMSRAASVLVIVDPDHVELSNLHRQIQFGEAELGKPKARTLSSRLWAREKDMRSIEAIADFLTEDSVERYLLGANLVIDGSDSYQAKFLVNDYCTSRGIPFVIASLARNTGYVFSRLDQGPCFRCVFEEPPSQQLSCDELGVLGPSCAIIAGHAAQSAGKLLRSESPAPLLSFPNLFSNPNPREIDFAPRPMCPSCGGVIQQKGENEMASVRIPTPLRTLTGGQEAVSAAGNTIGELITDLEKNYPGLKARICDDKGDVKRFVNIFANDEDIRHLKNLDTPVGDGDEISIVPAIAGGQ